MKHVVVIVLIAGIAIAACDRQPEHKDANPDHNTMDHSEMDHGKGHTMNSSAGAEKAPYDLQFIDTMIAHHEGAVDMALLAYTRAGRDELRVLAKNIVDDQKKEISQMREWRSKWFADAAPAVNMKMPGMAEGMNGMDLKKLEDLRSNGFDLEFIRQMIPHHEGALVMAKALADRSTRPELKEFAGSVIKAQAAEITQMRAWQASWK